MPQIAFAINAELRSIDNIDGGPQHIFPPTYAGLGHNLVGYDDATGRADRVLIDSVQSMANRVETALLTMDVLPEVTTQVGDRTLSINELPARAYDAILRDSRLDGTPWRKSKVGHAVSTATPANATKLFQHAPLTLLLGGWDSFLEQGGLGTKFPRALTAEIWGNSVQVSHQTYTRVDPLGIKSDAGAVTVVDHELTILDEDITDKNRPSNVGHGNIIASEYAIKGVFVDEIKLTANISINQLNRLRFPTEDGAVDPERDAAARQVLIQLGLNGLNQVMDDLTLRSGCNLVTTSRTIQTINSDGTRQAYEIAVDNLHAAIAKAETLGLTFAGPVHLTASPALEKLAGNLSV